MKRICAIATNRFWVPEIRNSEKIASDKNAAVSVATVAYVSMLVVLAVCFGEKV